MTTIAELNDRLRTTFQSGRIMITSGVSALGEPMVARVLEAVRSFSDFTSDNDPHKEHDFGIVRVEGTTVYFKIDYYAAGQDELLYGSENPADPAVTTRVMTIMLREEY